MAVKILAYEHLCSGGLASAPLPLGLAAQGFAMFHTVLDGLQCLGRHTVCVLHDRRLDPSAFPGQRHVAVGPDEAWSEFDRNLRAADAVILIAPETGGLLYTLTRHAERARRLVLGSSARAISVAGDKAKVYRALRRAGVPVPRTRVIGPGSDVRAIAAALGMPFVVKPAAGAGGEGSIMVTSPEDVQPAVTKVMTGFGTAGGVAQEYVEGPSASVSLVTDGAHCQVLSLNRQLVETWPGFRYAGGEVPFDHPERGAACDVARAACRAIAGLRGYVGVDVILSAQGPVVVDVNARWTVSAWALQRAARANLAAIAVDAILGRGMPGTLRIDRRVVFTVDDLAARFRGATAIRDGELTGEPG
ncbi:MAG: ATP-grasp domain-containing protein [Armatimonadota bacterium]|nr:ATP-grasp domain-containing protein [Armatimonadota bacterium]